MYESKFSLAEKKELVTKFKNRRINAKKFCKNYNIAPSTIYQWRKDLSLDRGFIPLHIVPAPARSAVSNTSSITSAFTVVTSDLSLEFAKGCLLSELKLVLELFNASK